MSTNLGSIKKTMEELIAQKEALVLGQIIQLVKDGILVVEESEGHIFHDEATSKYFFKQSVVIKSKQQEVIDQLKSENKQLKTKLDSILDIIKK